MADARKVTVGDADYADLLAEWQRNQSPYQFDCARSDGGWLLVNCPNYTAAQPDFFVVAEAGPTLFDENAPGDEPTTLGFIPLMLTYGGITTETVGQGKNRRTAIRRPVLPREPAA